jgi:8-amino-7-oxononanoate synthase
MDGDLADLPALYAICHSHGASLMVDDAHGFGVLGSGGRGTIEHFSAPPASRLPPPDVYVATLGKSIGAAGAFVAGSADLIEYLVQRARSWVFSTAPPPAIAAAAREGLRILRSEPGLRARLFENIARFQRGAAQLGIAPGPLAAGPLPAVPTPIQPLLLGSEARALALSRHLSERGYWVAAIRPPTVPPGTARLRITLSAAHTPQQIDGLLTALAEGLKAVSGRQFPIAGESEQPLPSGNWKLETGN